MWGWKRISNKAPQAIDKIGSLVAHMGLAAASFFKAVERAESRGVYWADGGPSTECGHRVTPASFAVTRGQLNKQRFLHTPEQVQEQQQGCDSPAPRESKLHSFPNEKQPNHFLHLHPPPVIKTTRAHGEIEKQENYKWKECRI